MISARGVVLPFLARRCHDGPRRSLRRLHARRSRAYVRPRRQPAVPHHRIQPRAKRRDHRLASSDDGARSICSAAIASDRLRTPAAGTRAAAGRGVRMVTGQASIAAKIPSKSSCAAGSSSLASAVSPLAPSVGPGSSAGRRRSDLLAEEHVLGAAEADALGAERSRPARCPRGLSALVRTPQLAAPCPPSPAACRRPCRPSQAAFCGACGRRTRPRSPREGRGRQTRRRDVMPVVPSLDSSSPSRSTCAMVRRQALASR